MAIINKKQDWIDAAKVIVPLLPAYMQSIHEGVDPYAVENKLTPLLEAEDWFGLLTAFDEIYKWLPDREYIRRRPFFDLCDLCSESWALTEVSECQPEDDPRVCQMGCWSND
jgi:hypothetical protein